MGRKPVLSEAKTLRTMGKRSVFFLTGFPIFLAREQYLALLFVKEKHSEFLCKID
jgi:hypothetical protein